MAEQFVKGFTNNHLTWVMVDATDFATPESALSAAMKIKIYGKLKSATGVNFVSSGTGSLTNDIQHVGASALGIYTIALAKADLSDASAAWYDKYIISLSATGAAYQAIVADGGIWISDLSAIASDIRSDVSDMHSDLIVMSDILSNVYSACTALSDAVSNTYSAVLLTQSLASDAHSAAVVAQGLSASDLSDLRSAITAITATLSASDMSDLRSAIAAGPAATVTASDISDIASAVWANAIGTRVDSRILVALSFLSDIRSDVSDMHSDLIVMSGIQSDMYSLLTAQSDAISNVYSAILLTQSLASDAYSAAVVAQTLSASDISDLRSAITAITATVSASDMSDIASRVDVLLSSRLSDILSAATQINSRVLLVQSDTSDIASRITGAVASKSQVASATYALFASDLSNITSAFAANSDAISDMLSDLRSLIVTTGVNLNTSVMSDIRSAIAGGPAATVTASDISDIASAVWANTIGARVDSRILVAQSTLSDIRSDVSDMHSDLIVMSGILSDTYSAVLLAQSLASDAHSAAVVAQSISASDMSDLRSAITGATFTMSASDISDIASAVKATLASDMSDILSAAVQTNSRVLVVKSAASDIYSLLSDVSSDLGVISGIQSDMLSAIAAGVTVTTGGITSLSFAAGAFDAAALATSAINEIRDAIIPVKNSALANIEFLMVLTSDHVSPATGLTVTGTRSLDGGAFGAVTGTIAEVSNGIYQLDASAADMNATIVTFRFTSATADDTFLTIKTGG